MIWTILLKELKDSYRDKRAFFFALIYGPFLMPAMMIAPALFSMDKINKVHSTAQEVHFIGMDRTPNLVAYLRSRDIDAVEAVGDSQSKLKSGEYKVVVNVSENYGENLKNGEPAAISIWFFSDNTESRELANLVQTNMRRYSSEIVAQRMFARGLDQRILQPFDVVTKDLTEKDSFLESLSRILLFLIVFPMVMGAFYIAVDLVAGEKERKTMEPLLSLAVPQSRLLFGKYLAILCFCLLCTVIVILNILAWLSFVPDQFYEIKSLLSVSAFSKLMILVVPLALFVSSLLLLFSTFSKTVKEAQTQLGFVILVVMSPMLILEFYKGGLPSFVDYVPVLGLYVATKTIVFEPGFDGFRILGITASTICFTLLCFWFSLSLFKRDGFLK